MTGTCSNDGVTWQGPGEESLELYMKSSGRCTSDVGGRYIASFEECQAAARVRLESPNYPHDLIDLGIAELDPWTHVSPSRPPACYHYNDAVLFNTAESGGSCNYWKHCICARPIEGTDPCAAVDCSVTQCYEQRTCSNGVCSAQIPRPSGTACNDGDSSTTNDQCDGSGVCAGSVTDPCAGVSCTVTQCYLPRTCSNGVCSALMPKPSGTTCDDGDSTTTNDECDGSGGCAGSVPDGAPACAGLEDLSSVCHIYVQYGWCSMTTRCERSCSDCEDEEVPDVIGEFETLGRGSCVSSPGTFAYVSGYSWVGSTASSGDARWPGVTRYQRCRHVCESDPACTGYQESGTQHHGSESFGGDANCVIFNVPITDAQNLGDAWRTIYCYRRVDGISESQGMLEQVDSLIRIPLGTTQTALAFVGLLGLIWAARAQLRTSKYVPIEDPAEL